MDSVGTTKIGGGGGNLAFRLDKAVFKDEGGGQWTLDTGMGGGSILDESDTSRGGYGMMRAYSATAWDSNYDVVLDHELYDSLNAAKRAIKNAIKDTL